jgi:hypothetical protein
VRPEKVQVFAIVRVDKFIADPLSQIAVQAVLPEFDEARAEAARLNSLVDQSRIEYLVRATRYYPQGRSSGTPPED